MATGDKAPGAFRTIGELSSELGVAQHILRYWESKFPQLKPLQRAGNRRYYRPADVDLARKINRLLNEEGYTVRGVQKLLRSRADADEMEPQTDASPETPTTTARFSDPRPTEPGPRGGVDMERLIALRDRLSSALDD